MKLYEVAREIRSKNAGPFTLTIDLMCPDRATFDRILSSSEFCPAVIASLYSVNKDDVVIQPFSEVLAIKVTLPRPGASSGAPGDRDVYGSQQHFPLANLLLSSEGL